MPPDLLIGPISAQQNFWPLHFQNWVMSPAVGSWALKEYLVAKNEI